MNEQYTAVFEYDGVTYEAKVDVRSDYNGRSNHRIYLWGVPDPKWSPPPIGQQCKYANEYPISGPHVKTLCKQCEIDKEWRRYNRDEIRIHKEIAAAIFPGSPAKIGFSSKAGCTCPCSPGLVVRDSFGDERFPRFHETFVTIKERN